VREAGVRVALDDFGTATSLRDLKRLAVDYVKLDREFVVDVDGPPEVSAFSIAVLNLADARGAEAVAKGIESREQAWRLAELGCRYGRGLLLEGLRRRAWSRSCARALRIVSHPSLGACPMTIAGLC
jgi:EAL domain-containing protein (putative c-di-GMP-specific phosphodiesterase class I)